MLAAHSLISSGWSLGRRSWRSQCRAAKPVWGALCAFGISMAASAQAWAVDRYVDASIGVNNIVPMCADVAAPCATIAFAAALSGSGDTIWLRGSFAEHGVLLAADVTVKGTGPGALIDAGGAGRHFRVASSGEVRLENLTLANGDKNGDVGGSVRVKSGSLVVDRVIFDGNRAQNGGAIACVEDCTGLTVLDSVFQFNSADGGANNGYGGAIFSQAETTIKRTLFTVNSAFAMGGGVYVDGLWPVVTNPSLTLIDSEFEENTSFSAGAVEARYADVEVRRSSFLDNVASGFSGVGGAVHGSGNRMTFVNSTFARNNGTYSGAVSGDDLFLANVTFVDNASASGASDFTGDTVEVRNSIVSHPNDGGGKFQPSCAAWVSLAGETNLLEKACDGAGSPPLFWFAALSAGSLGALNYHGGKTRSYELNPGSNAIDAGTSNCPGVNGGPLPQDQREIARPSGMACDIGSFER